MGNERASSFRYPLCLRLGLTRAGQTCGQRLPPVGGGGEPHWIGSFLGGLMLVGFGAGAIAKLVMLVGRSQTSEIDSSND